MSNSTAILNGDQVYMDELIRENARLTVQHEADRQTIFALSERVEGLEQNGEELSRQIEQAEENLNLAARAAEREKVLAAKLDQAVKDLRFVMAGGDPCKVCKNKCMMGKACRPRWKGLGACEEVGK